MASTSVSTARLLPAPRVITTSTKSDGTSVIGSDTHNEPFFPFGFSGSAFSTFHSSDAVPVSNTTPIPDPKTTKAPRNAPNGVLFTTADFAPHGSSPMHRSLSLDYVYVCQGEITMVLDGGGEAIARKGDVIVQRGAMHMWKNHTNEYCRLLVVMIGSEKIQTADGKLLEEFFPKRPV